ncbi:MAG: SGNH/GDSL hydrolase family protein [Pseudomonadota bacterium]|nr:SGNH/GDSL hydrolase family protein [Pseudomonadota bacterium]
MQRYKSVLFSILGIALSTALCLGVAEAIIRIKNSSMTNYDIEMWRYARELKVKSPDPALDFDHRHFVSAVLQNVNIRLNEWGLRGGPVQPLPPDGRRILFLGGSITLGWGVPEEQTLEARLQAMFDQAGAKVQVLNAGIGNYNTERYTSRFFKELTGLEPTDIVVQYFLRDAEALPPGGGNLLLRHSEIALTLWIAWHRLFDRQDEQSLVDHYREAYRPDAPGFLVMQQKLGQLAVYAREHHIRLYLAMTPDVHNLMNYPFGFVHDAMRQIAQKDGYTYIDLLPALQGQPPQALWAMPGDPHPSALGHRLMAEAIFPVISQTAAAP